MFVKLEQGKMEDLYCRDIVLFGAGLHGLRSLEEMEKAGARVLGFLDNDRKKSRREIGRLYDLCTRGYQSFSRCKGDYYKYRNDLYCYDKHHNVDPIYGLACLNTLNNELNLELIQNSI